MLLYLRLLSLLICAGCGYHFQDTSDKTTISIPYVKGDNEGQLTSELSRQLTSSGLYEVVRSGGNLELQVQIVGDAQNAIGYQYDRSEFSQNLKKDLMANENRRVIHAEVTLVDTRLGKPVCGPFRVTSSSEYDFVYVNSIYDLSFIGPNGKRTAVLDFSLGQLDSIEGAQDDAILPLYRDLSHRILDTLWQYREEDT